MLVYDRQNILITCCTDWFPHHEVHWESLPRFCSLNNMTWGWLSPTRFDLCTNATLFDNCGTSFRQILYRFFIFWFLHKFNESCNSRMSKLLVSTSKHANIVSNGYRSLPGRCWIVKSNSESSTRHLASFRFLMLLGFFFGFKAWTKPFWSQRILNVRFLRECRNGKSFKFRGGPNLLRFKEPFWHEGDGPVLLWHRQ